MTSPPRLQWLFGLLRKGGLETTHLSTGQQEVTNRLVTSEAILDAAATLCHVGAWQITVPEGKITWSKALCVIHAVAPGYQPTADDAISFYAPEHRGVIQTLLARCAQTGESFEVELGLVTASQKKLLVRVLGDAVRNASGTITHVQGAMQDISAIRQAEVSQRSTANRLSTTLETISDALVTLDTSWRFSYVNAQAEKLLQRLRADLLGRQLWEEFPDILGTPFEAHYREAFYNRQPQQFEAFYAPLGLWLDVSVYPSDEGLVVYFRDVTQRRADGAELELLKTAISRINDIVLITEAEPLSEGPRIVYVNDAFERRTGYSRAEVMGKSPTILQGPKTSRLELDRIRKALQAWQPVRAEVINYTKSGEEFWIELDIAPITDAAGHHTHWVAIERDVTERRFTVNEILQFNSELEDTVTRRTAQLTAVNKELEAFSYSVSHDLRGPVVAISGFAALLGKHDGAVLSEKGQRYLKRIQAGAAQMGELIEGVLVLAKSGSEPITRKRVDLSALAHRTARECQELDPDRHVVFSIQEGVIVSADALLMSVVLHNLMGNACKFSVKTPAARIAFGCEANAAGEPVYFVKDNGAGFDEAHADKLFGIFQRLHSADDYAGTGIGLANVRRVVERHGGTVWARSQLGAGATFYFTLG